MLMLNSNSNQNNFICRNIENLRYERRRQLMCPKASIRQETEKSREKEPTKARRFELSKIPSHVLKPTATRQFEGSSERRIGERETKTKRQ